MQQFAIEYTGSGNLNRFIDKMSGRTWQYHYDLSGRLHRLTNNKGFGIRYTYDDYDRVVGQRFRFGTSYSTNDYYDISYTYGDLSIPMSVSFGGTTKTRTLDTLGRTSSETLTTTGGANWVTNYGYLSPGSGKTSTVVNSVSMPSLGETYQYIYDENGNINQILRWGSSNPVTPLSSNTYLYDDIGQLTFENGVSYTYDAAGNILSKRYSDGTVIPYAYRTSGWTDQLISYNGQSITYDANGNALTWRDGLSFTWSNSRQLASVSKNGTSVASYTYDAFGTRATKVVNGVTTTFYYVDDVLYMQDDGTNRIWYYYDATGARIAMECNGIMSYYIYNLQGDVIGLYNSAGQVVARYTYDSWGNPLTITAANGADVSSMPMHLANMNPFRYRGYYYDVETGLYYLNSRYYDPEVSRFISADGQINLQDGIIGFNVFAYCINNPVNGSDPCGTCFHHWRFWRDCAKCAAKKAQEAAQTIKYAVPLYKQGSLSLCWAFCQTMMESYNSATTLTQSEAKKRAIEIAQDYHGSTEKKDWNKGGWPSNLGKRVGNIDSIEELYNTLKNNGPVYAYYSDKKRGAHIVIVTGVNLYKGVVYTNNPWGVSGVQSFNEFQEGFATKWYHFSSGKRESGAIIYLMK